MTSSEADADDARGITPVYIGPTWQRDPDHPSGWLLPERTLGWHLVQWQEGRLQHADGRQWRYTAEQLRLYLWWYALDDDGRWLYHDGVIQRLKGWGKDPWAATWAAGEFVGPCRPDPEGRTVLDPWGREHPAGVPHPEAWIQIAAVAKDQTRNTMTLFPGLFTKKCLEEYRIDLGKEIIYALGGQKRVEAVTSSPRALEGGRPTATLRNETHHWIGSNEGHEMDAVIERNATKSADGMSRALSITNAYDPAEDSVAQRAREAWEDSTAGNTLTTGIFYDSIEAPPEAVLSAEMAPVVVEQIRGDSVWLSTERVVKSILDTRNAPSRSRRWWYNQIWAAEDAWVSLADRVEDNGTVVRGFDSCSIARVAEPPPAVKDGDGIVLFFDGSKSDDSTALMGCRVEDGLAMTLGLWQKPPGSRGKGWLAPRPVIDQFVDGVFDRYRVRAFWADPSHTRDDETQERYWDDLIDQWHRRYRARLELWAVPGKGGHSVMWDMTSPARTAEFTAAAERTVSEIGEGVLVHDGDPRLRIHVQNARRYPNRHGVSLWKGHRESERKIDLAVAMVGARMLRRNLLNVTAGKKERTGKVW